MASKIAFSRYGGIVQVQIESRGEIAFAAMVGAFRHRVPCRLRPELVSEQVSISVAINLLALLMAYSRQLAKNRLSNNVGGVKHFWGALARALRRAPFRSR